MTTSRIDLRRRVEVACAEYIFNSLPTHLLDITDITNMSIVTRDDIRSAARSHFENMSDTALERLSSNYSGSSGDWYKVYIKELFKFAIFSHRWADREPSFQEMTSKVRPRPLPSGPGYEKLRHFCEKAQVDFSCRYAWSDTCCINKESSSELEEAIRSMYRWYSLAHICIVHLAESLTIDDFEQEQWFTRGWTLQELLAAKMIRFYSKNWSPIWSECHEHSDKDSQAITSAITRVTGIPEHYLRQFRPSCELVAEIMTWAANRNVTRIEDKAYSLLGLLNVSIPVAYGEGNRAFYRLMVALANECRTLSFFTWAGPHSDFSIALPSSPACYTQVDYDARDVFQRGGLGNPAYEATKLGVTTNLFMFQLHRQDTRLNVGLRAPLQFISSQALDSHPVLGTYDGAMEGDYAVGIVNFACSGPDRRGRLVAGRKYFGLLMKKAMWGWEKLGTDQVVEVKCDRDVIGTVESILLLHAHIGRFTP